MIHGASYYVESHKVVGDGSIIIYSTFYDINGNVVLTLSGTNPNEYYTENLDKKLDPACINKSHPTNILIYKHFKTGRINVSFKIGTSEIFTGYRYEGLHDLSSVLYTFKDRIDYNWCLQNKDKIHFEIVQNVNECIIL